MSPNGDGTETIVGYNKKMFGLGSKRSIIREIFEYSKTRAAEIGAENVYDFSLGNPSVPAPKEVNETIATLLATENSVLLHGYTSAQGDANVRRVIAERINKNFGVNISPNLIYMTCGAAASLSICLKAVIEEGMGDECIVFAPFFTEYRVFIENAGGKIVISKPAEKTFQVDIADFEGKINSKTKAVIVNSPNNPSGVVYSEETIKALCEVLERKSKELGRTIYLIADEPYRELVYSGVEVPYLMNYYKNTLVCYSFSKSLSLPGERIGYIAVSPTMEEDVITATKAAGLISMPGCATPSEMTKAYKLGADLIKLFPSSMVNMKVIKEIRVPLNHLPLVCFGGVSAENIQEVLATGVVGVGVASAVLDKQALADKDYEKITALAKELTEKFA